MQFVVFGHKFGATTPDMYLDRASEEHTHGGRELLNICLCVVWETVPLVGYIWYCPYIINFCTYVILVHVIRLMNSLFRPLFLEWLAIGETLSWHFCLQFLFTMMMMKKNDEDDDEQCVFMCWDNDAHKTHLERVVSSEKVRISSRTLDTWTTDLVLSFSPTATTLKTTTAATMTTTEGMIIWQGDRKRRSFSLSSGSPLFVDHVRVKSIVLLLNRG